MQISILFFGIAKDIVGERMINIEVEENCQVGQLKETIIELYPKFELLRHLAVAVNNEYASMETVLKSNDEIALIPPVSGG